MTFNFWFSDFLDSFKRFMVRMGKCRGLQQKKKSLHIVCPVCNVSLHSYPGMLLNVDAMCYAWDFKMGYFS